MTSYKMIGLKEIGLFEGDENEDCKIEEYDDDTCDFKMKLTKNKKSKGKYYETVKSQNPKYEGCFTNHKYCIRKEISKSYYTYYSVNFFNLD